MDTTWSPRVITPAKSGAPKPTEYPISKGVTIWAPTVIMPAKSGAPKINSVTIVAMRRDKRISKTREREGNYWVRK